MAFDIARGTQGGKDWAIEGDWTTDAVLERAKKNIPWKPVGIGAAVALAWFLWPNKKKSISHVGAPSRRWEEPTTEIPKQTMHETVYGRKKAS